MKFFTVFSGLLFLMISFQSKAQQISFDQLQSMVTVPQREIDTIMKNANYKLLQKEEDSVSSLHYYSNLEKITNGPSWVRSVSVMDATLNGLSSRLIKYRTYSKEEYNVLLAAMLTNNYHTSSKFTMGNSHHVNYENGKNTVLVKVTNNPLTNGKVLPTYEFEIGK
jgi:hypothetical protein